MNAHNEANKPTDSQLLKLESMKRQTRKMLDAMPPLLRPILASQLIRRANNGCKVSTNEAWMSNWKIAAKEIGQRHPRDVTDAEWEVIVNRWITEPRPRNGLPPKPMERSTAAGVCVSIKTTLGRFYPDGKIPPAVADALKVTVPAHKPKGRVLSKDDFLLLLDYVVTVWSKTHSPRQVAQAVALLWMLWDSWMRAEELLGLHLGDVVDNGDHAVLAMRAGGLFQKRGPRSPKVMEGLPALRLWIQAHPARGNPDAPLFTNIRSQDGLSRLGASNFDELLKLWGERSGLHASATREKKISAHDFRHTGNTRAARDQWPRSMRAQKAGWLKTSRMTEHYEHLDDEDMLEQMRRDAGIDAMGILQTPGMDDATRLAILEQQRQALLDRLAAKARSQATSPEWNQK